MPSARRATLRSVWWKNQQAMLRHCFSCGGKLGKKFVKEEACRRLVCISCTTITYVNPKVVAGLIPFTSDGRVLLLKRNIEPGWGKWTFPAGYQEMGETVEDAARRETFEETGVRVKRIAPVGLYSYADAGVVTIVYAGLVGAKEKPRVMPESQDVRFFDRRRIPWKEVAFRSTRDALKDWSYQQ